MCSIGCTACGFLVIFLVRAGNADGFPRSRCRTPGSERRLPVNVLRASPKEKLSVDFGTRRQTLPTNPAFFFPLFKCVGSGSCWRSEGKEVKEDRGKIGGGGGAQPQGRRKILYACALKHKVYGQLLKDFFPQESRLSSESGERKAECYMILSV